MRKISKAELSPTGRLISNRPEMQNIPIRTEIGSDIRKRFCEDRSGRIYIHADYSSLELKIMRELGLTPGDFKTKV